MNVSAPKPIVAPAAQAPNPEEGGKPTGDATLFWKGDPSKPDNTIELQGYGRATPGAQGGLGNTIHRAAELVKDSSSPHYNQAQGVYQSTTGALEIRNVGQLDLSQGDIISTKPLTIDPPADGSGYVPTKIVSNYDALKAIVSSSRFATFEPGDKNGVLQDIKSGPPGVAYPPTAAILPR